MVLYTYTPFIILRRTGSKLAEVNISVHQLLLELFTEKIDTHDCRLLAEIILHPQSENGLIHNLRSNLVMIEPSDEHCYY